MRNIFIVGGGQAGLQLGLSLQAKGYAVTLSSASTPHQLRTGRPMATPALFEPALATERAFGLNPLETLAPPLHGTRVTVGGPAGPAIAFNGEFTHPGRSLDPRLKMAAWLELAEERGATVLYRTVTAEDLDDICTRGGFDLVVVAAGRGDLADVFATDTTRTVHDRPQRVLWGAYTRGLEPDPHWPAPHTEFHAVPGVGELIVVPALSLGGHCDALVWEAVPGGPADQPIPAHADPHEILTHITGLIAEFTPWVGRRAQHLTLADPNGALHGRVTPRVRKPVAHLPGGGIALSIGDTANTLDPIGGQGANTAAKAAAAYLDAIVTRGTDPFDEPWMTATAESFWNVHGAAATTLTNTLLLPPQAHIAEIFTTAGQYPQVANRFANGLADPRDFVNWFTTPRGAAAYLAIVTSRTAATGTARTTPSQPAVAALGRERP